MALEGSDSAADLPDSMGGEDPYDVSFAETATDPYASQSSGPASTSRVARFGLVDRVSRGL